MEKLYSIAPDKWAFCIQFWNLETLNMFIFRTDTHSAAALCQIESIVTKRFETQSNEMLPISVSLTEIN